MPIPILPDADLRRELRNLVSHQKRELLEKLETSIEEMREKFGELIPEDGHPNAAELNAQMKHKLRTAIDQMEAKKADVDGGFEQFYAFIDNAQFPNSER